MSKSIDELEEAKKLLYRPVLYSIPAVTETFREKISEFYEKRNQGIQYTEDELFQAAIQSIKGFVRYVAKDSGGSGLIQKIIMKNAKEYFADAIVEMLFGK